MLFTFKPKVQQSYSGNATASQYDGAVLNPAITWGRSLNNARRFVAGLDAEIRTQFSGMTKY